MCVSINVFLVSLALLFNLKLLFKLLVDTGLISNTKKMISS